MKDLRNFVISSRYYLLVLLFLCLVFYVCKEFCYLDILKLDEFVSSYVQSNMVKDLFTPYIKLITNLGDVVFFVSFLFIILLFFRKKSCFSMMTFNLLCTFLFSVIFKNIFMRERPLYNLIEKPNDYSFPSGHTMCSVAFYGFLIYLVSNYVDNKILKVFLTSLCVVIIFVVGFSRLYLNVHYFTDVICGAIFGFVCLLMFINYVKINNII